MMKKKIEGGKRKDGSRERKGMEDIERGGEKSQKLKIQAKISGVNFVPRFLNFSSAGSQQILALSMGGGGGHAGAGATAQT
jgi:hypothetical protein